MSPDKGQCDFGVHIWVLLFLEKEKDYGNTTNVTSRSFLLFLPASQVDSSKGAESGFVFSLYFVDPNASLLIYFLLKPNY